MFWETQITSLIALFWDWGQININKMDKNSKEWSSKAPGYIIFLVDQSGSMIESYPEKGNKANFTALVINRTINELISINMDGELPKNRVFISIIGYGGKGGNSIDEIRSDFLGNFADKPLRMEVGKQKVSDGNGGLVEINVDNAIFIEPVANGLTPMGNALEYAKKLIEDWLSDKPKNPAPIVINISDGMPYNGNNDDSEEIKSIEEANFIMNLRCEDGNPLIFNAHIGNGPQKCICSSSESELPDEQAKFLFKISSKIPKSYQKAAEKEGLSVQHDSRGFVSNADPDTFIKFISFGSSGGQVDKSSEKKDMSSDENKGISNENVSNDDNDDSWMNF